MTRGMFLTDKFLIPVVNTNIKRTLLQLKLREALDKYSATVIKGRTGTGKTSLAVDFAQNCRRPVAWLKIDATDIELPIFFSNLIESIKYHCSNTHEKLNNNKTFLSNDTDSSSLAETFIYHLIANESNSLLCVLDDLHHIYDTNWFVPFFQRLLPLLPFNVHFILIGRSLPPAPLWRLRSKQKLYLIDETTLNFSYNETKRFCVMHGISDEKTEYIYQKSKGRVGEIQEIINKLKVKPKTIIRKNTLLSSIMECFGD